MVTKILTLLLVMTSWAFAQEGLSLKEKGKAVKVYPLENEVIVYPVDGVPFEMNTNQRSSRRMDPRDRVSEVFADSADGGGRVRALPGGIIVELAAEIDVDKWASDNNLNIQKKLDGNSILIESSPGRKTLEELAGIEEKEGVVSAKPNWWTKMEAKTSVKKVKVKNLSYPSR